MSYAKESKKKRYQEPTLTDLGHGSQAREKIIDLAISKGISSQDLNRLLSELGKRKIPIINSTTFNFWILEF